jgi:hypothetical protein
MSWENHSANVAAYNALWLERVTTAPGSGSMATTWRRTKWAVLIRYAWWLANTPDAPDMSDVWSASSYIEWLRWPPELFRLADDHPDANAAELAVMWWADITPETWGRMLSHDASRPWLAAATPPGRRYPLDWPGRKDTAP